MPGLTTVYRWLRMNEGFRHQYAHAREDMADTFGDQILKIADDDSLTPESRRLRIDTRKWLASKLAPKRYGDKLAVGGDEGNPIQIVTEVRRTYVKPGANNA